MKWELCKELCKKWWALLVALFFPPRQAGWQPTRALAGYQHTIRKSIPRDKLHLYATGHRCYYCNRPLLPYNLSYAYDLRGTDYALQTTDHIVPRSKGGTNWPDNLVYACESCNYRKYTKSETEFRIQVEEERPYEGMVIARGWDKARYLYLFKGENALCKLGTTRDMIQALRKAKTDFGATFTVICVVKVSEPYRIKRDIQARIESMAIGGGWYILNPAELLAVRSRMEAQS